MRNEHNFDASKHSSGTRAKHERKKLKSGSNLIFDSVADVRRFLVKKVLWEQLLFLAPDDVLRIFLLKGVRYKINTLIENKEFLRNHLFMPLKQSFTSGEDAVEYDSQIDL